MTRDRAWIEAHVRFNIWTTARECKMKHPCFWFAQVDIKDMIPVVAGNENGEDLVRERRWFFIARRFARQMITSLRLGILRRMRLRLMRRALLALQALRVLPSLESDLQEYFMEFFMPCDMPRWG